MLTALTRPAGAWARGYPRRGHLLLPFSGAVLCGRRHFPASSLGSHRHRTASDCSVRASACPGGDVVVERRTAVWLGVGLLLGAFGGILAGLLRAPRNPE